MENKEQSTESKGIKLAGDLLVVPGSSLMIDGKVKEGLLHAGAGILAGVALGIPGLLLVAANSFSLSTSGKNLAKTFSGEPKKDPKDVGLREKIEQELAAGLTVDEITARLREDIEDISEETKGGQA